MNTGLRTILIIAVMLVATQTVLAQEPVPSGVVTGSIVVEVVDAQGNPFPGVVVEADLLGTGRTLSAVSDSKGKIRIPEVPFGTYDVRGKQGGFRSAARVAVAQGQAQTVRPTVARPIPPPPAIPVPVGLKNGLAPPSVDVPTIPPTISNGSSWRFAKRSPLREILSGGVGKVPSPSLHI